MLQLIVVVVLLVCWNASGYVFRGQIGRRTGGFALRSGGGSEYTALLENVQKTTPKGSVIVIKYGGHAMENEELKQFFCEDVAALCRVIRTRSTTLTRALTPVTSSPVVDWHLARGCPRRGTADQDHAREAAD